MFNIISSNTETTQYLTNSDISISLVTTYLCDSWGHSYYNDEKNVFREVIKVFIKEGGSNAGLNNLITHHIVQICTHTHPSPFHRLIPV